jgi:hypothetical protein
MNLKNSNKKRGQVVILAVLFFTAISMIIVLGFVLPSVREVAVAKNLVSGEESYFVAEAGVEDVVYRLKTGMQVSSSEVFSVGDSTVTINTADSFEGKTVTAEGNSDDYIKRIETKVTQGEGAAFNYGVQAGTGGFTLTGGSTINGNVYANGTISGDGGSHINGSATAANGAALTSDQTNDSPSTPGSQVVFANANGTQDFAQSFQVSQSGVLNKIQLELKRTSSTPADRTIRIVTDNGGVPSTTNLSSQTLSASLVTTSFGWVEVVFPDYPQLTAGTTYWLVIDGGSNSSKYFTIAANNTYANGTAKIGKYSGTWNNTSPSGLDAYFRVYMGGVVGKVYGPGGSQWYQPLVVTGDSWANTVEAVNTGGDLYCQTSINNSPSPSGTPCDTSKGDPSPIGYPLSDALIDSWKTEAEAGGTQGSTSVGWAGATIGPRKINGDLTISGGGTLTLTGTVYVTGNVTTSGGGKIKLDSSYGHNSGVLVTDGKVSLTGDGQFSGSGQSGSYPLLVTTSDCPASGSCGGSPAIYISGGSGAVILSAQNGTLQLNGGSAARSLTANEIVISGGGTIDYDSGIADISFATGPSGSWEITQWKEIQ